MKVKKHEKTRYLFLGGSFHLWAVETAVTGGRADSASWIECSENEARTSGSEDRRGMEAMGAGRERGWRMTVSVVVTAILDMAESCSQQLLRSDTIQLSSKSSTTKVRNRNKHVQKRATRLSLLSSYLFHSYQLISWLEKRRQSLLSAQLSQPISVRAVLPNLRHR